MKFRKILLTLAAAAAFPCIALAGVTSYSTTPANNNSAPPNGAPEGMTPGSVNDVIRQVMTDIAVEAQKNQVKMLGSVAGTNTITGSMSPALTSYSDGMLVVFNPAATNSGAVTLNVNSLGAVTVNKLLNGASTALVANDLVNGVPALVVYDSSASAFRLINPYSGEWSAGVLASDIARLSQQNTFTALENIFSSGAPQVEWNETDAAANNRLWKCFAQGEAFTCAATDDADSVDTAWLGVQRTGTTVDSIALAATSITLNGVASSDFARLSQANTFTGGTNIIQAAGIGQIALRDTTAGSDEKGYSWRSAGGQLFGFLLNDAGSALTQWVTVSRSGTTSTGVNLQATTVQVNGQNIRDAAILTSGTLPVARGGTGTTTSTGTGNVVLSASPTFTGTVTGGTFSGTHTGDGSGLTGLDAGDISAGTLAIARGGTGQTDGTARNITGKAGVTKTLSTSTPSGGSDGDIWYRY